MCGFVGYFSPNADSFAGGDGGESLLEQAADTLAHRGPDGAGLWCDAGAGVGLAFRRLAILDLSPAGEQPMESSDGRYRLVFNGEIYNFRALKAELDKEAPHEWRGHCDTEVLLELIRRRGLESALQKTDGMFALALWDSRDKTLSLARDRFGEKPLYMAWAGKTLLFGSELKALKTFPGFDTTLDRESLALYFRNRYVPGTRCIYQNARKLAPATTLAFHADSRAGAWPQPTTYWNGIKVANAAMENPFSGTEAEALDEAERLFTASVSDRLESDVALGAFLSGGIDSSLTVAIAQRAMGKPMDTFTIRFEEDDFNEAPYAQAVAGHLQSHHNEITVTERDALGVVDRLSTMYDEPFADPSQLPTAVLSAQTRQHVTVALSGDGGDELFCGYGRYQTLPHLWARQSQKSPAMKGLAAIMAKNLPVGPLDALSSLRPRPGKLGQRWFAKLMEASSTSMEECFGLSSGVWRDGVPVSSFLRTERRLFDLPHFELTNAADVQRMMFLDARTALPDGLMVKVDRAAMAASLEVRTPFLNADLARFAWSLPLSTYDPATKGLKWVLKSLLKRHIPEALVERPKMGFDVPIRQWLRGELRDWGETLVTASPPGSELLDMARIEKKWRSHQQGANHEGDLWPALVLLSWMQNN